MLSKELEEFIDDIYDIESWEEVTLGDKDIYKLKEIVKGLRKLEFENQLLKSFKGIEELPHWGSTKKYCKEIHKDCEVVKENKYLNYMLDVALKDYDRLLEEIGNIKKKIEKEIHRTKYAGDFERWTECKSLLEYIEEMENK